jgi:hypothetical protein
MLNQASGKLTTTLAVFVSTKPARDPWKARPSSFATLRDVGEVQYTRNRLINIVLYIYVRVFKRKAHVLFVWPYKCARSEADDTSALTMSDMAAGEPPGKWRPSVTKLTKALSLS